MAVKHKVSGWSLSGSVCPPFSRSAHEKNAGDPACEKVTETALQLIRDNGIKNVIIVARWDLYAPEQEKGGIETAREPSAAAAPKEAFAASLQETVKMLEEMGANVWIMKQVPPQIMDPPSSLALAQYLARDPKKLERPYADILHLRSFSDAAFSEAASRYPINFIDPAEQFCPGHKTCRIASEGRSLYMDSTHVSHDGALWSQDMLEPFFKSLQQ